MKKRISFAGLLVFGFFTACSPVNQATERVGKPVPKQPTTITQSLPPKEVSLAAAQALFVYQEGIWDSKWDWVDVDGNLLGSVQGIETFTAILDGSVQEILNDVPDMGGKSKAVMTYNHAEQKIIFFSMGAKGDYWLMKQDPVTGNMVSEPHPNPDGSVQIIRFTTTRKTDYEMDIVMESSKDAGESWTKLFTQYMRKRQAG